MTAAVPLRPHTTTALTPDGRLQCTGPWVRLPVSTETLKLSRKLKGPVGLARAHAWRRQQPAGGRSAVASIAVTCPEVAEGVVHGLVMLRERRWHQEQRLALRAIWPEGCLAIGGSKGLTGGHVLEIRKTGESESADTLLERSVAGRMWLQTVKGKRCLVPA